MGCGLRKLRLPTRSNSTKVTKSFELLQLSRAEVDYVLSEQSQKRGAFLLYQDTNTTRTYLAFKSVTGSPTHHSIIRRNDLFYIDGFPFPYLEAIVFYYQRHKFNGTLLTEQAYVHPYISQKKSTNSPSMSRSLSAREKRKSSRKFKFNSLKRI